jgi:hypothetical protein
MKYVNFFRGGTAWCLTAKGQKYKQELPAEFAVLPP